MCGLPWGSAGCAARWAASLAGAGEGPNERGRGWEAGLAAVLAAAVLGLQDSAVALRWVGAGASYRAGMRPDVGKQVALPDCGQVPLL